MAMTALNQYELKPSDSILLEFISPEEEVENEGGGGGSSGGSSGSGGGNEALVNFSIHNAIDFLFLNKGQNNLFGGLLYSDWVAIGISKAGNYQNGLKEELFNYYKDYNFISSIITDNERHAMVLMSLNINPYSGKEINYIEKIVSSFDGEQIGDPLLYNDDIFALIVLYHAGYNKNDLMIKKIVEYIISMQNNNGSWNNVDMTSASIQALRNYRGLPKVIEAIEKAESFLLGKQEINGSFGNSFSTSWAVQALSQNNLYENQINKAIIYLTNKQKEDGGLDEGSLESRIWATAYAIPAVLKLSWNDIFHSFDREEINNINLDLEEKVDDSILLVEIIKTDEEKNINEEIILDEVQINSNIEEVSFKKKEKKEVIEKNNIDNKILLASIAGAIIEINDEKSSLFININSFFQKVISFIERFWSYLFS